MGGGQKEFFIPLPKIGLNTFVPWSLISNVLSEFGIYCNIFRTTYLVIRGHPERMRKVNYTAGVFLFINAYQYLHLYFCQYNSAINASYFVLRVHFLAFHGIGGNG